MFNKIGSVDDEVKATKQHVYLSNRVSMYGTHS